MIENKSSVQSHLKNHSFEDEMNKLYRREGFNKENNSFKQEKDNFKEEKMSFKEEKSGFLFEDKSTKEYVVLKTLERIKLSFLEDKSEVFLRKKLFFLEKLLFSVIELDLLKSEIREMLGEKNVFCIIDKINMVKKKSGFKELSYGLKESYKRKIENTFNNIIDYKLKNSLKNNLLNKAEKSYLETDEVNIQKSGFLINISC